MTPPSLPPAHTTFIFAVGEVDPQSSGRKQRQRDGQTTASLQTAENKRKTPPPKLMMFTVMLWDEGKGRNRKARHFLSGSSVYWGTSFCLFSSFCRLAAAVLTPGSLFGSRRLLLLPSAHTDSHRRLSPQGGPSCKRTIKRRAIGSHQTLRARFQGAACNGLRCAMKSNQTERSARRGGVASGGGGGGARVPVSISLIRWVLRLLARCHSWDSQELLWQDGYKHTEGDSGVTARVDHLRHLRTSKEFVLK